MRNSLLWLWLFILICASLLAWTEWRLVARGQFVHATAHLLVAWLLTLVVLTLLKHRRLVAVAAAFCVVFAWTWSEPLRTSAPDLSALRQDQVPTKLRAVWFNAWGSPRYIDAVRRYAVENSADVLVLCQAAGGPTLKALTSVYPYAEYNRRDQIGIWSRFPLEGAVWHQVHSVSRPRPRSWLSVRIAVNKAGAPSATLPLLVGHVKVPKHEAHVEGMAAIEALTQRSGAQVLFADLNTTPWAADFRSLLQDGWHDARAGQWPRRTWRDPSYALLRWPIDHVLTRGACRASSYTVGPNIGSDHYPLLVEFEVFTS